MNNICLSVLHTLSIDTGEPDVTVINTTVNTADISFNFDGMCDVTVQVIPNGLDASLTSSGTVITVTVSERTDSDWNIYSLQLLPTRRGRSWPTVSTTVFYGLEIQGFQVCNFRCGVLWHVLISGLAWPRPACSSLIM